MNDFTTCYGSSKIIPRDFTWYLVVKSFPGVDMVFSRFDAPECNTLCSRGSRRPQSGSVPKNMFLNGTSAKNLLRK
jgi:hypothetical protein